MLEKITKYSSELNCPIHFIGQTVPTDFRNKLDHYDEKILDLIGIKPILYRGTSFDRLEKIYDHGTDGNSPTDGFWASWGLDKALEYGPLILAYDLLKAKSSLKKLHRTKDKNEIESLRDLNLIEEYDSDGIHTYFSRIPSAFRRPLTYEREYGYWIPENPKKALEYLIVLGSGENWLEDLEKHFQNKNYELHSLDFDK